MKQFGLHLGYALGLHLGYNWVTLGLHLGYTRATLGLHLGYTWVTLCAFVFVFVLFAIGLFYDS